MCSCTVPGSDAILLDTLDCQVMIHVSEHNVLAANEIVYFTRRRILPACCSISFFPHVERCY